MEIIMRRQKLANTLYYLDRENDANYWMTSEFTDKWWGANAKA